MSKPGRSEKVKKQAKLGAFLRELRKSRKASIREVAIEVGISAPYLYQIEFGKRALTDPAMFQSLAAFYNIQVIDLLKLAGYIPDKNDEEVFEKRFQQAANDPRFKHGAKLRRMTDINAKRFIVELFEMLRMRE